MRRALVGSGGGVGVDGFEVVDGGFNGGGLRFKVAGGFVLFADAGLQRLYICFGGALALHLPQALFQVCYRHFHARSLVAQRQRLLVRGAAAGGKVHAP